jgi:parvulin-like peptidyl-prolyl isomerase
MTEIFRIGNQSIQLADLPSLLARYQLLPQLFRNLIVDQAIAKYSCSDTERDAAITEFFQQQQITTDSDRAEWLRINGLSPEHVAEIAVRPLLLSKFKEESFAAKVEAYFFSRKSKLDQVVYSLIRTKDPHLAQELYFRIQEGEASFSDMARQHSQGLEANTGGVIGPTPLGNPHPAIAHMLSVSKPGQLWAPVRLDEWLVILRLEMMIPAQLDDRTRSRLIDEMFETWLKQQLEQIRLGLIQQSQPK